MQTTTRPRGPRYEFDRGSPGAVLLNLTDTASFGVLAFDELGRFMYANQSAETLLGYEPQQLVTRSAPDLLCSTPKWLEREFGYLRTEHAWSGRAVLRGLEGDRHLFAVNALAGGQSSGSPNFVAFLHPSARNIEPARVIPDTLPFNLTAREVSLLQLMAEGFADKQIADLFGNSVWKTNKDVGKILEKMNANSRTRACVTAIRSNLIL